MTYNQTSGLPCGVKFTPKETLQDKTTAIAMQIIADARQHQIEQIAKLRAARAEKAAAEARDQLSIQNGKGGFTNISHRMPRTAAKAGKPKANQIR